MKTLSKNWLFIPVLWIILIGLAGGAQAQTNISNSPGWFSSCPRLAVDPAGNIHAVWVEFYTMSGPYPTSGDAFYSKYNIATKQWSTPINLSNSGRSYSGEWYVVGIDSDAAGNVYVVYLDRPTIKLRILSGGSWSAPFEVGYSPSTDIDSARVGVDASGNIFVSWCDSGYRVVYSRARVGGQWEDIATLTYPGTVSKFPEISVGSSQVYCVFMDNRRYSYQYNASYVHRATTFGASWSSSQRLTNAVETEEHPAVRVDSNNVAHVVYTPYFNDASRIVRYVEGTSNGFSAPLDLGRKGGDHYPTLYVRGTNIYTSWQSYGVHYNDRVGGVWTGESAVPNSSGLYALTDVATSPTQDKIYYVWDSGSGEVLFTSLQGPGPFSVSIPKSDFNGDGQNDILWRYFGPEGYNVIWYMGYSGEGLAPLGGISMDRLEVGHQAIDMLNNQSPQQVFLDPREAAGSLNDKAPQPVFRDVREVKGSMEKSSRESQKLQRDRMVPVLYEPTQMGAPVVNGAPFMKVAGSTLLNHDFLPAVEGSLWEIAGTGDFNGDGKNDILWRYYGPEGYNVVWYMDGKTLITHELLPAVADPEWRIAGTGDFNSDGKIDVLWRHYGPGGENVICYMNGATPTGYDVLPAVTDTNWEIVGIGDFNGDAKVDILWRNNAPEGQNVLWYMDGKTLITHDFLPAVMDTLWKIVGVADFSRDGKVDILWRYYGAEGYNVLWYMDGKTLRNHELLPAVPGPDWKIQNH